MGFQQTVSKEIDKRRQGKDQFVLATGEDEAVYAIATALGSLLLSKLVGYDWNFSAKAATMAGISTIAVRFALKDKVVTRPRDGNVNGRF